MATKEEYARYAAYGNNNPELDSVVPVNYRKQSVVPQDPTFSPVYGQYDNPVPFYQADMGNSLPYSYRPMVEVDSQGYPLQRNTNYYKMPIDDGRMYVSSPYDNRQNAIGSSTREQMAMWENEQAKKEALYQMMLQRMEEGV